tara:strand:- start:19 stop:558 length:540 start_codon:yes stop_codon:yes gene_type:complete
MFSTGVLAAKVGKLAATAFDGGGSDSSSSEITSTVTMGTLSNVSYGSGYGYATAPFAGHSNRAGGSNPSPTTQTFGGQTFNHLSVGDITVYGSRTVYIEIPFNSNASNHPTSDWLNSLTIDDGQGNSVELDMSNNYTRNTHTGSPYYSRGAIYYRGYGTNAPVVINSTNNNKTLTWDFV